MNPERSYPYTPEHADDIELGDTIRDLITGAEGVATSKCEALTGCTQYCVTGKVKEDGKYPEQHWLDWQRLEVLAASTLRHLNTKGMQEGGRRRDGAMGHPSSNTSSPRT